VKSNKEHDSTFFPVVKPFRQFQAFETLQIHVAMSEQQNVTAIVFQHAFQSICSLAYLAIVY
jgi:hypothetical protein